MNWKEAVKISLENYSLRHGTIQIDRRKFLDEEQQRIVNLSNSNGKTPSQTISRVLQELRDQGLLFFSSAGRYVLTDKKLDVLAEDAPDDVLDRAAIQGNLVLKDVAVSDKSGQSRLRRGIGALRRATLSNYCQTCALCDIKERSLLVTSHVARWADRPEARGLLSNTICFCSFHDSLFENGFFSLDDHCQLIARHNIDSKCISIWLKTCTFRFRLPTIAPAVAYLQEHRERVDLH